MNYVQLVAEVSAYTENAFNTSDMDTFIKQAEQRIYNAVQFPALRKNVTGTCTTSNTYLQCPLDYLATYSMAVIEPVSGAYTFLLNKDVNFLREAYPTPTSTGVPKYYAIFGPRSDLETELAFILGPTPDKAYSVELHYFYYPTSIVTAGTSWLGDNFDSVLLYGALVEAYTFMKGEADMMQLYDGKFKEALLLAKRLGDGMEKQDAYRSGQAKTAVT
jgi:hypothetical protein